MNKDLIAAASPDQWSQAGGLGGLVIWALFLMLALMIWVIEKKLNALSLGQHTSKAELAEKIERVRADIIEWLYEAHMLSERRKRNQDTIHRRRRSDQ